MTGRTTPKKHPKEISSHNATKEEEKKNSHLQRKQTRKKVPGKRKTALTQKFVRHIFHSNKIDPVRYNRRVNKTHRMIVPGTHTNYRTAVSYHSTSSQFSHNFMFIVPDTITTSIEYTCGITSVAHQQRRAQRPLTHRAASTPNVFVPRNKR